MYSYLQIFLWTFVNFESRNIKANISAQVHYCDHALSVVRPSVVINFSHLQLLLCNHWTEFKETWQEAQSRRTLPSLFFSCQSEKQDGLLGLWLGETFLPLLCNPWMELNESLQESRSINSSTKFVWFFGAVQKTKMATLALIWLRCFDFISALNCWTDSTKLNREQDLNVLFQVCVFPADLKSKMAVLASDWVRPF